MYKEHGITHPHLHDKKPSRTILGLPQTGRRSYGHVIN